MESKKIKDNLVSVLYFLIFTVVLFFIAKWGVSHFNIISLFGKFLFCIGIGAVIGAVAGAIGRGIYDFNVLGGTRSAAERYGAFAKTVSAGAVGGAISGIVIEIIVGILLFLPSEMVTKAILGACAGAVCGGILGLIVGTGALIEKKIKSHISVVYFDLLKNVTKKGTIIGVCIGAITSYFVGIIISPSAYCADTLLKFTVIGAISVAVLAPLTVAVADQENGCRYWHEVGRYFANCKFMCVAIVVGALLSAILGGICLISNVGTAGVIKYALLGGLGGGILGYISAIGLAIVIGSQLNSPGVGTRFLGNAVTNTAAIGAILGAIIVAICKYFL